MFRRVINTVRKATSVSVPIYAYSAGIIFGLSMAKNIINEKNNACDTPTERVRVVPSFTATPATHEDREGQRSAFVLPTASATRVGDIAQENFYEDFLQHDTH